MKRLYQSIIEEHIADVDQMAFMPGPRQVGKTTIVKKICEKFPGSLYLNWDFPRDRELILSGSDKVIASVLPEILGKKKIPILAFDEIHKFKKWKNYLKGYFDYSKGDIKTLVTGSAKLNLYKKGGDSLMGRYFLYHIHPFSVAELLERAYKAEKINAPKELDEDLWQALFEFGGFPEPLFKQNKRFLNRWQQLRFQQLFQEDIREASLIPDLAQMEVLAHMLYRQAGMQINYHSLAKMIQITDKTAKKWLTILEAFYFSFSIRPWSNNVSRSLIKGPKLYLWDWSLIEDRGARVENFIASHLFKAVDYWNDIGLGQFALYYLRDKDKREVDFLITQNGKPWILAEVKSSPNQALSQHLHYFQKQLQPEHVFQIAFDMPYVDQDCFTVKKPIIVPAKTFLSQLV